jgi:hypothetical protein
MAKRAAVREKLVGRGVLKVFGATIVRGRLVSYAGSGIWDVEWDDYETGIAGDRLRPNAWVAGQVPEVELQALCKAFKSQSAINIERVDLPSLPEQVEAELNATSGQRDKLLIVFRRFQNDHAMSARSCARAFVLMCEASVALNPEVNGPVLHKHHKTRELMDGLQQALDTLMQTEVLQGPYPQQTSKGFSRMLHKIRDGRGRRRRRLHDDQSGARGMPEVSPVLTKSQQVQIQVENQFKRALTGGRTEAATVTQFRSERSVASTGVTKSQRRFELTRVSVLNSPGQQVIDAMPRDSESDQMDRAKAVIGLNSGEFVELDAIDENSTPYLQQLKLSTEHVQPGSTEVCVDHDVEYGSALRQNRGARGIKLENLSEIGLTVSSGGGASTVVFDSDAITETKLPAPNRPKKARTATPTVEGVVGRRRAAEFRRKVISLNAQGAYFYHYRGIERQILLGIGVEPDHIIDHGQSVCMMVGAKANGAGSPITLSMDNLAYLLGFTQTHHAKADCLTQRAVMNLLLRAYVELSEQ